MPDRRLKLRDKGSDVTEAQGLLNRNGAILDPDGDVGAGTPDHPVSRKEMRDIRDAVAAGRNADVPAALRAMKRLWPEGNGLRARREREAKLFEEDLAQG